MMSRCQELRKCPASQYLACEAYLKGLECWQVADPRCTSDLQYCMQYGCPVYDAFREEIEDALKARAMGARPRETRREGTGSPENK